MPPMIDPQSIEAQADNVRTAAFRLRQFLMQQLTMGRRPIWSNPKFTPQEMVAQLGADAAFLFAADETLTAAINQFKPGGAADFASGLPAGWTYVIGGGPTTDNPLGNGTVTLTPPSA